VALSTETLHAKPRTAAGTRACRRLRAEGQVPAIVYGRQAAPEAIQVSQEDLDEAVRRRARMFELEMGKTKEVALLKEVQYDAFGSEIIHADFVRVALDEAVTLTVPIQLKGAPKVEHAVLQQTLGQIEIECLPKDIPDAIVALVADMQLGDTFKVSQLTPAPGVKILTEPDVIVAALTAIEEEVVAPAAAPVEGAAVEPEVIGRKVEEGEEAEEVEEEKPKEKKKEKE
jgi:large subunit ribosomal protein L25